VLAVICANSMALTSWTPTGALSKVTQFSMGAIDRTNPASNLIPAGMTGEISANASNLLSDIKPGYMLGAKPRQQAIGHVIGVLSGAVFCIPLFFLLFLPPDANGVRHVATIVSDQFAQPAALQWKGVAELIAKGLKALPHSAIVSMVVAAIAAAAIEIAKIATRGRFALLFLRRADVFPFLVGEGQHDARRLARARHVRGSAAGRAVVARFDAITARGRLQQAGRAFGIERDRRAAPGGRDRDLGARHVGAARGGDEQQLEARLGAHRIERVAFLGAHAAANPGEVAGTLVRQRLGEGAERRGERERCQDLRHFIPPRGKAAGLTPARAD